MSRDCVAGNAIFLVAAQFAQIWLGAAVPPPNVRIVTTVTLAPAFAPRVNVPIWFVMLYCLDRASAHSPFAQSMQILT